MKLNTIEPPHAFCPRVASYFGGGSNGVKAAILFHKIVVAAQKNNSVGEPMPFYKSWFLNTYPYFTNENRDPDAVDILVFMHQDGAIVVEEDKHNENKILITITERGSGIIGMVLEKNTKQVLDV